MKRRRADITALEMAAAFMWNTMDEEYGKQWVMLAAGSKTWNNYRHQANVCHAYQMMHQNGIPDDQIVVMMYDDIAYNSNNPFPGNIINKPNGPNVYSGVPKDYTREDVTATNFLAALRGDRRSVVKRGPIKVITSGRNDTIFVYLTDHGNRGIFCFPHSTLYAQDLIETIKEMARDNKFSKMVIYMECCYSGSMFTQLPNNVHVYAVSSARSDEPSHACYLDYGRKTFLADEFSAVWMYYNEAVRLRMFDLNKATFQDQFASLQENMKKSHSCRFGDMTIGKCSISEFLNNTHHRVQWMTRAQGLTLTHLTPSHEVPFKVLEHQIETETDAGRRRDLIRKHKALCQSKVKVERVVGAISQHCFPGFVVGQFGVDVNPEIDLHEFKTVAEHFRTTCFNWHEEEFQVALSYMHVFAHLCAYGVGVERIKAVITRVRESSSVFH